jgi:hypothetical protein
MDLGNAYEFFLNHIYGLMVIDKSGNAIYMNPYLSTLGRERADKTRPFKSLLRSAGVFALAVRKDSETRLLRVRESARR